MRCSQTSTASKIKKRPSSSSSSSSLSSLYCSSSSTTDLQPPDQTAMTRKKKKKKNATVRLSTEPQGVAARERRHRISERFKILKSLVPGGSKMDTVSMLDQAILYVKLLKAHIWLHQNATSSPSNDYDNTCTIDHYYNMTSTTLHHDAQIAPYSLPFDHSHAYM